jgi:hypothetical protein
MSLTRAQLQSEANTNLADNTTGSITPAILRNMILDVLANLPTLLDADTFAAVKTFTVPPVLTGLSGVLRGNGSSAITALTNAALAALVPQGKIAITETAVNVNATGDTMFAISLPSGFTRYKVSELHVSNASLSLTTAQIGLYTGTLQGGVNIVAQTLTGITQTATDTNLNAYSATIVDSGTRSYNDANLYLNVGTAQGAAATADFTLIITPLP